MWSDALSAFSNALLVAQKACSAFQREFETLREHVSVISGLLLSRHILEEIANISTRTHPLHRPFIYWRLGLMTSCSILSGYIQGVVLSLHRTA